MTEMNVPPYDPGNPFVQQMEPPAFLSAIEVEIPGGGHRLMVTIRCATTTLTILLPKDDAKTWARLIEGEADKMSDLVVPPAAGRLIVPNGHGPN